MRRMALILVLTLFSGIPSNLFAYDVVYTRTPAPSPDGSLIAFAFQGDIWTVPVDGGEARRLTAHPAYDYLPHWSPQGNKLAFSSDRYDNFDVFLLDFETNRIEQLTYFTNTDRVSGWMPDGQSVLFSSNRDFYYHRLPQTYQVSMNGETPELLIPEFGFYGKVSPDGNCFAFVLGRNDWERKGYRGSSNMDIWLYEFASEEYTQLTDFNGTDMNPLWSPDSETIYFVSDRDGMKNLWQMNRDGTGKRQLTSFKDNGVLFPNISDNGSVIAFERDFRLWTYSTKSGEMQELDIRLPLDFISNPIEYKTFTGDADEFALNAKGNNLAFAVRGEIFAMKEDGAFLNQITDSPWRQQDVTWFPYRDSLVYVSDELGQKDLYLAFAADSEPLVKSVDIQNERLTSSSEEEYDPKFSPDGNTLAYVRGKGNLILRDVETGKESTLVKGWASLQFSWSPDSHWIAYSREDNEFNEDVHIVNVQTGESHNISQHPDEDFIPKWSPDGTRLAFVSQRTIDNNRDLYYVHLRKKNQERSDEEWDEYFEEKKDKDTEFVDPITIDFEDIHLRINRITSLPGAESSYAWSPDGQFLVFRSNTSGKSDLWKVKWNSDDLKQITEGDERPGAILWHKENNRIYYLKRGGKIVSRNEKGSDSKSHDFRAEVSIDHQEEQRQKFQELWRILRDNFYDPDFHGANWDSVRIKYGSIIVGLHTTKDFNDAVELMLGELNASHLGIGGPYSGREVTNGMLGLRFSREYDGEGLQIAFVMPDGPCDTEENQVKAIEILTAINGTEITGETNMHRLLWNQIGEKVRLTLRDAGKRRNNTRDVVVKPVSYGKLNSLEYERWMKGKREKVHNWSENKLGYIHIRSMSNGPLERFEMALYAEAHDKEGLVIDVRNNGGGWITDYLLAMLMVENHAVTIPRDGGEGYPQSRRPLYAFTKPIIVLCNEYSYSNAEIFSHAIKTLDRGKLVGVPTGGLVISTGGTRLIDGSSFRIPFRGWYVVDNMMNMENNGAVPDIIVRKLPGDTAEERDRQLRRAVNELLKDLKN